MFTEIYMKVGSLWGNMKSNAVQTQKWKCLFPPLKPSWHLFFLNINGYYDFLFHGYQRGNPLGTTFKHTQLFSPSLIRWLKKIYSFKNIILTLKAIYWMNDGSIDAYLYVYMFLHASK